MKMRQDLKRKAEQCFVTYEIGEQMPDKPSLHLQLTINKLSKTIAGQCAVAYELDTSRMLNFSCYGSFTSMSLSAKSSHILISCYGYSLNGIRHSSIQATSCCLECHILLSDDWQTGICSLRFIDQEGNWHDNESCPCHIVNSSTLN